MTKTPILKFQHLQHSLMCAQHINTQSMQLNIMTLLIHCSKKKEFYKRIQILLNLNCLKNKRLNWHSILKWQPTAVKNIGPAKNHSLYPVPTHQQILKFKRSRKQLHFISPMRIHISPSQDLAAQEKYVVVLKLILCIRIQKIFKKVIHILF